MDNQLHPAASIHFHYQSVPHLFLIMSTTITMTAAARPTTSLTTTTTTPPQPTPSSDESYYDEIEIEDMTFDSTLQIYHYPCPCGDRFEISIADLRDGEDVAVCPGCSLMIKVVFDAVCASLPIFRLCLCFNSLPLCEVACALLSFPV